MRPPDPNQPTKITELPSGSGPLRVMLVGLHFSLYCQTLFDDMMPLCSIAAHLPQQNYCDEVGLPAPPGVTLFNPQNIRRPGKIIANAAVFSRILHRFRPDFVHFQESKTEEAFLYWWIARRYKRVLTVHDPQPHLGRDSKVRSKNVWIRNRMREQADAVIVHARSHRVKVESSDAKVHVVPHPVFRPRFVSCSDSRRAGPIRILMVGRMEFYKGMPRLIEACELLSSNGAKFELRLAGRGPALDEIRPGLHRMPWVSVVDKYLTPEELEREVADCDILVLPYLEGTASGIIAFGLGLKKCMVATSVGGFQDYLTDGVTGLLVEPGNAHQLARALYSAISSPELRARLESGLAEYVSSAFPSGAVGRRSLYVYRSLIG